jgi:uncharacterized Zn ribbon protein
LINQHRISNEIKYLSKSKKEIARQISEPDSHIIILAKWYNLSKSQAVTPMQKKLWLVVSLSILLITFGVVVVSALPGKDDGLSLSSPSTCPSSGCAAGQFLHFTIEFQVQPKVTSTYNTQVCVYTPDDGQSVSGTAPWADYSDGWIAQNNSNPSYQEGERNSICTNNTPPNAEFLTGAYAKHTTAKHELVEFATHINKTADRAGIVWVKIFQLGSKGRTDWLETSGFAKGFSVSVPTVRVENTAYVAETSSNCGSFFPCYFNTGDDKPGGHGTAMEDAISALDPGGTIIILKDLWVKESTIIIDKNLTIEGHDRQSMLTSTNTDLACGKAMLHFQSGGTLQNLTINDGNCSAANSRTLVEIDSPEAVVIKNNTLNSGKIGVDISNNPGAIEITFNEITNNQENAITIEAGSADKDRVKIFTNNILNNGDDVQVHCNNGGIANHNYWGPGENPEENTTDCGVKNGKQLGTRILSASDGHGVQAILAKVEDEFNYYFNDNIGARHTQGDDFNIVIVNHGQGKTANIPFYDTGSGDITPCSNFYDIFLAEDASPNPINLELAIKYDLNSYCIHTIETDYYCGNNNPARFPLWWYDPMNEVTDGWDGTGQDPQGPGGVDEKGQVTTCNLEKREIIVEIDLTGRPRLFPDMEFTPFTTGFIDGASLTDFSAVFTNYYTRISWQTVRERNIKSYELLRSQGNKNEFTAITEVIVNADSETTNNYQFFDYDVDLSNTYYYKLRVIHNSDESETIGLHGPITVSVPAPTITNTPTITRTPVPTSTPIYRTPTRS